VDVLGRGSGIGTCRAAAGSFRELIVWDASGRLAFERLQNRLQRRGVGAARAAGEWPVHFVAFDLLRLSGTDTTGWPYRRRRAALESVFAARRPIPMESEPHDVNRQSCPQPGAATLKKLTVPPLVVAESLLDRLINTKSQVFMNSSFYRPN